MDDNSLFFALNRRLSIFTRCLSLQLIHGLAVLVLAGGSASAWAQAEPANPVTDFCDLVMAGGSGGGSCAALAEDEGSGAKVSYVPAESLWRVGEGPTVASGSALFSAAVESGESSCLRMRLRLGEERQLVETNLRYRVDAGTSTGTLTILLERGGETDAEEILRASGEAAWATLRHTVDLGQSPIVGISICYEGGSGGEDAGLDRAGVDNIRLDTVDPVAEFCDLVVAGGSGGSNCAALAEDEGSGAKVSYVPPGNPWRGGDGNSGLALFSAEIESGESSCLRLRLQPGERRRLVTINFAYTLVSAGTSNSALTISLERDGEVTEEILRQSGVVAWTTESHTVDLNRSRVVSISICYGKGSGIEVATDRAGLDDLSFVYEYVYDRDKFCDVAVQGGRAGENCGWIRGVQSDSVDELWGDSASFMQFGDKLEPSWVVANLDFRQMTCLRLLLQPRLDSSALAGLSFNFRSFGFRDRYEFRIQRVGQQNSESIRATVQPNQGDLPIESYTSDLDLASGLISSFIVCYSVDRLLAAETVVQFALNTIRFEDEVIAVSRLRSTLPSRRFHIARRPQSVDFAVQALSQAGTVIDSTAQTMLTARSDIAGMRLSLTVSDTGQSASGVGEVSLPLSFSGEQNVVLGFDILLAVADGITLAVTVSPEEESIAGESRELQLFDFCGLAVQGGRDNEGDEDLQQSCSDFARAVSAVYFDPPDKPWQVAAPSSFAIDNSLPQLAPNGQTSTPTKPWRAPGQPDLRLYSPPLQRFEKSCMHLQLSPLATVTGFSLHWFLTSSRGDDFTISLGRADTNGEEEVLRESGWVESWAPFSHTVSSGQSSRMSFCYETTAPVPREGSGAGVDNLRLEYTLSPAEFTGDETVTKDDLLLALRTVGACSEPADREDCIATKLSALVANLGLGALDARMVAISEALLALTSPATRNAYDFDRSGVVDEVDFRVLLRYLAGLRGTALVETEGDDSLNESFLRAILGR